MPNLRGASPIGRDGGGQTYAARTNGGGGGERMAVVVAAAGSGNCEDMCCNSGERKRSGKGRGVEGPHVVDELKLG